MRPGLSASGSGSRFESPKPSLKADGFPKEEIVQFYARGYGPDKPDTGVREGGYPPDQPQNFCDLHYWGIV